MDEFDVFLNRKQQEAEYYEENLKNLCCQVIVPTIEKYYKHYLVSNWRPFIDYGNILQQKEHSCVICLRKNKLEFNSLGEKVEHVCNDQCGGCEFDLLDVQAYYTSKNEIHVCVGGVCKREGASTHHNQIDTGKYLDNVYICKTSYKVHLCGIGICDRTYQTKDGHQLCELTGLGEVGADIEKHLHIPLSNTFTRDKRGEFLESASERLSNIVLQSNFNSNTLNTEHEKRGERKRESNFLNKGKGKGARSFVDGSLKQEYLEHAINKVGALLNLDQYEERMNRDAQGYEEGGSKLDSYTGACHKNGSALCAFDMMLTLIATRRTYQSCPHIMMNTGLFSQLVRQTAVNCLKFWAIIRTKTHLGKTRPNLFPFSDFIEASLCLFGRGISVPGADGKDVTIIPANQIILLLMPEKHHEVKQALYGNTMRGQHTANPEAKHIEWINALGFRMGNKMAGHLVRNRVYKYVEQLSQQRQELKSAVLGETNVFDQWKKRKQREHMKQKAMDDLCKMDKSSSLNRSDSRLSSEFPEKDDTLYMDIDADTGLENEPALQQVNRMWEEGEDENDPDDNDPEVLNRISEFVSGTLYTRKKKSQKRMVVRKYAGKCNSGGRSSLKIALKNGFGSKGYSEKVLTPQKRVIEQYARRRRRTVQRSSLIKNIKGALFSAASQGVSPYELSIDNISVDAIPEDIFAPLHRAYIHVPQ